MKPIRKTCRDRTATGIVACCTITIGILVSSSAGAQLDSEAAAPAEQVETGSGLPVALEIPLPAGWFELDSPPLPVPQGPEPAVRSFDRVGINELTFDDIKFEIEVGEPFERGMLTRNIELLDQLKIRIRGFIRPSFKQSGLDKFVFVRDNQECCFGPGAALYDCILVELVKGTTTDFSVRPVTISGTFYVREYLGPDGETWAIFRMKDARVE
jgi:hypothetical protein